MVTFQRYSPPPSPDWRYDYDLQASNSVLTASFVSMTIRWVFWYYSIGDGGYSFYCRWRGSIRTTVSMTCYWLCSADDGIDYSVCWRYRLTLTFYWWLQHSTRRAINQPWPLIMLMTILWAEGASIPDLPDGIREGGESVLTLRAVPELMMSTILFFWPAVFSVIIRFQNDDLFRWWWLVVSGYSIQCSASKNRPSHYSRRAWPWF